MNREGIIAWFARNHVAANLLMLVIMVAGFTTAFTIKKEIFPEFSIDTLQIRVPYRGAAPEEVENGVVIRIEESIQSLNGIKRITSFAFEGIGIVQVEMEDGYDLQKLLNEIKVQVDGITTFPANAERPIIRELTTRNQVMWVNLYGDVDEGTLKAVADQLRDRITALPGVTQADVQGTRRYEISIEVSEAILQEYGLTFDEVAQAVRKTSLDLPAGSLRTEGGEILLRTKGQAYTGEDFSELVLRSNPDGTLLTLGQVARIVDGFEETSRLIRFNGKPSVGIQIFRVGDQSALDVAAKVREFIDQERPNLPDGLQMEIWADGSRFLKERLRMLIKNGLTGLALVFLSLTLFLRPQLAVWVCIGIPLTFLGALWVMPMPFMDVSINMITLFGFIVVLGIVVDDAIVIGENVHTTCRREGFGLESTIKGAREVAVPATFGVLTTVVAFLPMLMVPGVNGKIWSGIALVVIAVLLFSLVESKLILPAHLATMKRRSADRLSRNPLARFQAFFSEGLLRFVDRVYRPVIAACLRQRYTTVAGFIAILILSIGLIGSGLVRFVFFPNLESDFVEARVTFAEGTPPAYTVQTALRMERALMDLQAESLEGKEAEPLYQNILTLVRGDNELQFFVELAPSESRRIPASEIANRWRERVGVLPGTTDVSYSGTIANSGRPIDVQLQGRQPEALEQAAQELKERLAEISGVFDISDSSTAGKREIMLHLKPEAEVMGLTLSDLARQARQGFFGEEAQRIQRGRDDVRVMVRYPRHERESIGHLENMRIRTPGGSEIPFAVVAEAELGRGFSSIRRANRQRVVNVRADLDKDALAPDVVRKEIMENILPEILARYPGVSSSQEGEAREQSESLQSLVQGTLLAAFLIYALMAIPLKSYVQPFIIMSVIPFGLVGAIGGHILMGLPISILSLTGMVALAGVVVNNSLVMVNHVNQMRAGNHELFAAVVGAGTARFRAILLTSMTTFLGLLPILLEKSLQAKILIPMAVSLAFGVLFATVITLLLIPCLYIIIEDLRSIPSKWSVKANAAMKTTSTVPLSGVGVES